jgi:type I restriction enzyme M protein
VSDANTLGFRGRIATKSRRFARSARVRIGIAHAKKPKRERKTLQMANERKTEALVRDALREHGYYDDASLAVDEQISDNPRIKKLLKMASKRGLAGGYPEFIICSSTHSDLLIVVECKADPTKHESATHDNYAEYAVDGALLYASYLSKDYDVIAIGVSGQTKKELNVSHYLFLKGSTEFTSVFGPKILPFADYYSGYISNPRKFSQDYTRLLGYSKELNEILHAKKVKESQRSLLISGILIALKNPAFEVSFKKHKTAQQLANSLVATIVEELSSSDLPRDKVDTIRQGFGFIKTHATLSKDKLFFQELIVGIDEHINSFRKTHKYIDTLGQFYIEFLRYANNDKELGIVLTPPHITELFSLLAGVNKDSTVLDNTCGTGGFLISAMRIMVADAQGDSNKIKNIQRRQLVGIEYQDDIYSLAVTNMVLHDDGKSNIDQGDCFQLVVKIRDKYKPNVGLLNPPYKTKKSVIEELEYVLNNLEMLQPGGICVAIVPISCVIAQESRGLELKKKLLANHTLEAVLSMPGDLFHNSGVGVVTAAIVVTAHVPHPKNKKTWFGYCRDDGFVKTKHLGRIDKYNRWGAIRDRWVNTFQNRESTQGFSLMQKVEPTDEWCVEGYMKTDYSTLSKADFEREVKRYVAFRILDELPEQDNDDTE